MDALEELVVLNFLGFSVARFHFHRVLVAFAIERDGDMFVAADAFLDGVGEIRRGKQRLTFETKCDVRRSLQRCFCGQE